MSRIGFLTRHPKRSLSALGTVLAAAALTVGSGAFFTTSHSNPNNTFKSGTLAFTNVNDAGDNGGTIFDVDHLRPGGPEITQTATLANTGDVPADFFLSVSSASGDTALLDALDLVVKDEDGTTVYNGKLTAMPADRNAGHIADGDSEQYEFSVSLPDTGVAQNDLMGKSGGLQFDWKAVSTPNP